MAWSEVLRTLYDVSVSLCSIFGVELCYFCQDVVLQQPTVVTVLHYNTFYKPYSSTLNILFIK